MRDIIHAYIMIIIIIIWEKTIIYTPTCDITVNNLFRCVLFIVMQAQVDSSIRRKDIV